MIDAETLENHAVTIASGATLEWTHQDAVPAANGNNTVHNVSTNAGPRPPFEILLPHLGRTPYMSPNAQID